MFEEEKNMVNPTDQKFEVIAETEHCIVWKGEEADGEVSYHIEVGNTMLTFYTEDWIEIIDLMKKTLTETK